MRSGTLAVAVATVLAGCATRAPLQTVCLPLKPYTPAQEQLLAAELASLPPGAALVGAMADYGAMRSADRACQARAQ